MRQSSGFTLIELIIVIVLIGVLSVVALPKFIDFSGDASQATFRSTASAFKSGVEFIHLKWQVAGNNQAQQDFIPIADPGVGGDLSVNANGFPADTRGTSLTLNSDNDCLDVWRAVLNTRDASVATNDSALYEAQYNNNFTCTYSLVSNPTLTVDYDSTNGDVTINF